MQQATDTTSSRAHMDEFTPSAHAAALPAPDVLSHTLLYKTNANKVTAAVTGPS